MRMRQPYGSPSFPSAYAHVTEVQGPGNEYDYTTNDYIVVYCPACGVTTKSFGATGMGWASHNRAQAWADDHNARFHAKEIERPRGSKPPVLEIQFRCSHIYPSTDDAALIQLGAKSGPCAGYLGLCEDAQDELGRPMYKCSYGHYSRAPRSLATKAIEQAVAEKNVNLSEIHRQHRVASKIAKLEAERSPSSKPSMIAAVRANARKALD